MFDSHSLEKEMNKHSVFGGQGVRDIGYLLPSVFMDFDRASLEYIDIYQTAKPWTATLNTKNCTNSRAITVGSSGRL
jgi:hypothetical protein